MTEVTVDFVAFDDNRDACLLVLVEKAWCGPIDDNLRALQARFYGCLNAVLDGQIAKLFPKSRGRTVIIQVDCYDLPIGPINDFVQRFEKGIATMPDYATEASPFAHSFQFEVNHDKLPA